MGSDNHLKTHFAQSMQSFVDDKFKTLQSLQGQALPCHVTKVISSGIVEIGFDVNSGDLTLPKITVPVHGAEWIRYPIQIGDKGKTVPSDTRLGGISGLGTGIATFGNKPSNLGGLSFQWLGNANWTAATDPNSLELYGPNGVILRDQGSHTIINITPSGITITLGGDCNIVSNGHNVNVTGGGDVIAGGISLKSHHHTGVTVGSGNTGGPV